MKRILGLAATVMAIFVGGCAPLGDQSGSPGDEGGANVNDRSSTHGAGEILEAGAMAVSSSGNYIVARRNATTLIVDVRAKSLVELDLLATRFVFAKTKDVVYVVDDFHEVVALNLATRAELWRAKPIFEGPGTLLARVTDDDRTLLIADTNRVFFLDSGSGDIRGATKTGPGTEDIELLPGGKYALVVGSTVWRDGGPHTPVSLVPLDGSALATTIDVPNCAAPIAVIPDGKRALLSPTFCTPDAQGKAQGWSNPDPVSVIDIDASTNKLSFLKNLPGFGPVALLGPSAVAYLDTKRMDPAMFADRSQVPAKDAPEYQLMTIDPATLAFDLHPIGETLPRFAPSKDGKSLLVDASVSVVRVEASTTAAASITLTPDGQLSAEVKIGAFGDATGSLFGVFGLDSKTYTPFQGPAASLDRFVQLGDGSRVFTLKNNGSGGDLFGVDVGMRTSFSLGLSLRDIAILPDGKTLVLRIREERTDGFLGEQFCFSTDGQTCSASVNYVSPIPQHDP